MSPAPPADGEVAGEPVDAVALDRVPVGHHKGRDPVRGDRLDGAQDVRGAGTAAASAWSAAAWIVGPSIIGSEYGQADLDDVDTAVDHRVDRGDARRRRSESRPEGSRRARARPSRLRLREDRADARGRVHAGPRSVAFGPVEQAEPVRGGLDVLVAAAGQADHDGRVRAEFLRPTRSAPASACADSIAGMIPSVRESSAQRVHRLGVGDRLVVARPVSCSHACSGPTPG